MCKRIDACVLMDMLAKIVVTLPSYLPYFWYNIFVAKLLLQPCVSEIDVPESRCKYSNTLRNHYRLGSFSPAIFFLGPLSFLKVQMELV